MKIYRIIFATFFIIISISAHSQNKKKTSSKSKKIDSITVNMKKTSGLITTYFSKEKEKVFFEIQDSILSKDLLMVTRYAQLPSGFSAYINAGSKTAENLIHFTKEGKKIMIKQISYTNIYSKNDPISLSVIENNFSPILASFEIKNSEKNRFLIDVTNYFMADSPGFNIITKTQRDKYKIKSVDKKRSQINSIRSFPRNTEVLHTLTFGADKLPWNNKTKTFSFQINHSIIALPENRMPVRYADNRVGWFTLKKYDYSSKALKSDQIELIRKWRLEPKDIKAYKNGELTEPKKQIVYYLDPGTPIKWRPYFKKGIEDWNSTFEKAGFKNVIIAKDPPSKEEDPDFSPEDIRYSTVRYVASTTRNAVGPSVSDPRTGEIIESDIIWYHNHLRSYRNRFLIETGAANPKARTLNTPEEEIGEMMRRVISHEIGHALGLPHNMKASSAYPVDSLRSGNFTQKMGIATTIMDYARYNYVAQPGDKNIRFVRQLGPYDDYSIEWGYRYFPGENPQTEKTILKEFVDKKSLNPMYMFGGFWDDPNSQTENIGDDPVKATDYGIKNLKIVINNLDDWTTPNGASYEDLKELYGEFISVYRRYIYHVINIIGGVHETRMNKGQNSIPYINVSKDKQLRALNSLDRNLWKTQYWLMPKELISKIESKGVLDKITNLQKSALYRILSTTSLNRILSVESTLKGDPIGLYTLINTLQRDLISNKSNPDLYERNLQKNYVIRIIELSKDQKLNPEIQGYLYKKISEMERYFKNLKKNNSDLLKTHYSYCHNLIKEIDRL